MRAAAQTDPGRVRPSNEDCVLADANAGLLIVADGMGGHAAGEIASAMAVKSISAFLGAALVPGLPEAAEIRELLARAIDSASAEIHSLVARDPALRGMGTTLVVAVCQPECVTLGHVGDSRAYLIREGRIRRLTQDHSVVEQMVNAGQITPEEARRHHLRNIITRSLGFDASARPELQTLPWAGGDYLLLCTDGLTGMLEDEEIAGVFARPRADLAGVCAKLIALANARGGSDNVSAVVGLNES